jgi:hypothetical protein
MRPLTALVVVVVVLTSVGRAAGDLPAVIGGDGMGGKLPAVAAPSCPADSVFGQQGFASDAMWYGKPTEFSTGFYTFENFSGATEEICGIRWWGVLAEPGSLAACQQSEHTFQVLLFDDDGGSGWPGSLVDDFYVEATRVDTGIDYVGAVDTYRLYEYQVTFPYCVELPSGWISVADMVDSGCWFWWLGSPEGDGFSVEWSGSFLPDWMDFAMCLFTSPDCPGGSLLSQRPNYSDSSMGSDADPDLGGEFLAFENFPAGGGPLSEPICELRWWGTYSNMGGPCSESQDNFEINFYEDDGGQPGDEVYSYRVVADRQDAGFSVPHNGSVYEFSVDLPSCCPMASGWVSIQGYGGDTSCWHAWIMSLDGDFGCAFWNGYSMSAMAPDLSLCLGTKPDGDDDLVPDDLDDCPGTARGDPVDDDGCSTADDDGDGVLNDQDECAGTPRCADVDADGCPSDADGDGVADGCDECADTPTCATNINSRGCARDSDGDGSPDGCPPATQDCCGATGPVAPLGLAIGMLLLSRFVRRRR